MLRIVQVRPLPEFRLHLRYADGVEGEVDLSRLAGNGVFKSWNTPGAFESVAIGSGGELRCNDDLDLCPVALYMEITGKTPEEVFAA